MTLNLIAYSIYLGLTSCIILVVGNICYQNGNIYVRIIIPNNKNLCLYVNRVLLIAYYLLNIGYCATTLVQWEQIDTIQELIEVVVFKIGIITGTIALLHYFNIFIITNYLKKIIN